MMHPLKLCRAIRSICRWNGRFGMAQVLTVFMTSVVVVFIYMGRSPAFTNTERMTVVINQVDNGEEEALDGVKKEMFVRQKTIEDVCSRGIGVTTNEDPPKAFYVEPYDFYVCLVAKVASTFWSRFLYQLHHTFPVESPFDVKVFKAYGGMSHVHIKNHPNLTVKNVTTKLLFVREPFGRLFSAYVDKLLPPNPVFWKYWGQRAILEFRPNHLPKELVSGNDTTFSEFISFATRRGSGYDVHLIPIYKVCNPCQVKFNTIGKMESFEKDAKYTISRLGIPEIQIGFDRMKKDQQEDALSDSTGGPFSAEWLNVLTRYINLEASAQRIWRKLQIRGLISWRQNLRLTPYQREHLNMIEMMNMLKKAQQASKNQTELKIQKKQAFLEAYSTLRPDQIAEIKSVYGPDFDVFGYDKELVDKVLQSHSNFKNTGALDWSKDWDLSPVL